MPSNSLEFVSSPGQVLPDTPGDRWLMHSNFVGVQLSNVAYGVTFIVFYFTIQSLLTFRTKNKMNGWLFAFTVVVFVLATIAIGTSMQFATWNYIDYRNFPDGGIIGYNETQFNTPVVMLSMASYMAIGWVADALMLFRLLLIWGYNYWIMVIPSVMFLGSFGSSIAMLRELIHTRAGEYVWGTTVVTLGKSYWTLSITFNLLVTLLIAGRILANSRRLRGILGPRHAAIYTSVASMVIESGALYAIAGLAYFVAFVMDSYVQNLLIGVFGQVQAISPMLIILRVAQGRSWDSETSNASSTWKVDSSNLSTTQDSHGPTTIVVTPIPLSHIGKSDTLASRESGSTASASSYKKRKFDSYV